MRTCVRASVRKCRIIALKFSLFFFGLPDTHPAISNAASKTVVYR